MSKFKQLALHPLTITIFYPVIILLLFLWTNDNTLFVIFICYAIAFLSITIHELGHLLVAISLGSKLHFMSAGPILILPNHSGGLRLSVNDDMNLMFGMMSSYIPNEHLSDKLLRKKMIPTYLGGPLANLLAIGVCLLIRLMPIENGLLWDTTSYFIIINIALFFATAIPIGSYTDGAKIKELFRKKNMSVYRTYNQYLNPSYKLSSQDVLALEQQLNETTQITSCYNVGILLIQEFNSKQAYSRSLNVIDQLISKLTKGDGPIMENLIYFYRGLLLWASKAEIDQDTLTRLKHINSVYGRSFCYLANAMIQYAEGTQTSKQQELLHHSKKWLCQLMDHRQENIITNAINSIEKEMCA